MSSTSYRGAAKPAADANRLANLGLGAAHLSALPAARAQGLEEGYALALQHFQRNERAAAHGICRQIASQYPDFVPAWQMKWVIENEIPPPAPFTAVFLYQPAHYEIGAFCYGVPAVYSERFVGRHAKLRVGRFTTFALDVTVLLGSDRQHTTVANFPFPAPNFGRAFSGAPAMPTEGGDVDIGADVRIGHGALICAGVAIGDGAVIEPGSVVTEDVAAYTVVAGNPAREIRRRCNEETSALLQRLRWWDWPLEKIRQNLPLLCSADLAGLRTLAKREARD